MKVKGLTAERDQILQGMVDRIEEAETQVDEIKESIVADFQQMEAKFKERRVLESKVQEPEPPEPKDLAESGPWNFDTAAPVSPPPSPGKHWEQERRKRLVAQVTAQKAVEELKRGKQEAKEKEAKDAKERAKADLELKKQRLELQRKKLALLYKMREEKGAVPRQEKKLSSGRKLKKFSRSLSFTDRKNTVQPPRSRSGTLPPPTPKTELCLVGDKAFIRVFAHGGTYASVLLPEGESLTGDIVSAVCKKMPGLGDTSDWGLFEYVHDDTWGDMRRGELGPEDDVRKVVFAWESYKVRKLRFEPRTLPKPEEEKEEEPKKNKKTKKTKKKKKVKN